MITRRQFVYHSLLNALFVALLLGVVVVAFLISLGMAVIFPS